MYAASFCMLLTSLFDFQAVVLARRALEPGFHAQISLTSYTDIYYAAYSYATFFASRGAKVRLS